MSTKAPTLILNDSNYTDWVVYAEAVLVTSDFWDIIDGSSIRPLGADTAANVRKWMKRNQTARAKLVQLVDPSQYVHLSSKLARECWDTLANIHRHRGLTSRQPRLRNWVRSEIEHGEKEETFIGRIRQEARVLIEMGADITDQWIILVLCMGVFTRFPSLVKALDNVEEEKLTIEYVVQRILNAAALRTAHDEPYNPTARAMSSAAAARHRPSPAPPSSDIRCHRCSGFGHMSNVCPSPPRVGQANPAIAQEEQLQPHAAFAGAAYGQPDLTVINGDEESFSFL